MICGFLFATLWYIGSVLIFMTVRCLLRTTWPVSTGRPVSMHKCFLLRPIAKHASCLSGPCRNIFACRQPTVDFQKLQCSVWAQARIVCRAVLLKDMTSMRQKCTKILYKLCYHDILDGLSIPTHAHTHTHARVRGVNVWYQLVVFCVLCHYCCHSVHNFILPVSVVVYSVYVCACRRREL